MDPIPLPPARTHSDTLDMAMSAMAESVSDGSHAMGFSGAEEGNDGVFMPVISDQDLGAVAEIITSLHSPQNTGNPQLTHQLQRQMQDAMSSDVAWGLLAGLMRSPDPIIKFYGAQTAQTKIARDWESLPTQLQPVLLDQVLTYAAQLAAPLPENAQYGVVVRKLFSCIAGLILRMTPKSFSDPLVRVITSLAGRGVPKHTVLQFLEIVIHDISRGALVEPRKSELATAISTEMPLALRTITEVLSEASSSPSYLTDQAFKTLEAWVAWGLTGEDITALLPILYNLLGTEYLPSVVNVLVEILTASIFKDGKATKILTEPLLEWFANQGQRIIDEAVGNGEGDSEDLIAVSKLVEAVVEHSAAWLAGRTKEPLVQRFFNVILTLSGFPGVATVDEVVSELQEALIEDPSFQEAYETSIAWGIAKDFFRGAVQTLQGKIQFPTQNQLNTADAKSVFEVYRRDAGEVMVTAYYVLRNEMLEGLLQNLRTQLTSASAENWQPVESTLHCIRYASEAVPLSEDQVLPQLFSAEVYARLPKDAENRTTLTALRVIRNYEEWFKNHTDSAVFVLDYVVAALDHTYTAPEAANALKAICDICRGNLTPLVSSFGALHGKVSHFQPEEQIKVIEAIASVLQALPPSEAVEAVVTITQPLVDKLLQAVHGAARAPDAARAICIQQLQALAACAVGLTPADEDMFDPEPEDTAKAIADIDLARQAPSLCSIRDQILSAVSRVMEIWSTDSEMATIMSHFVKNMTSSPSTPTLLSLPSVPFLKVITTAAHQRMNSLWLALATTLIYRLAPAPGLRRLLQGQGESAEKSADAELLETVQIASQTLIVATASILRDAESVHSHPDVAENFFKFASAIVAKFPSCFSQLSPEVQSAAVKLSILGLGAQERFSLVHAIEFLVAVYNTSRHNPAVAEAYQPVILENGRAILQAIVVGAGLHSPRSSIPNFAELLVASVTRIPNETRAWLSELLSQPGFPGGKESPEAKRKLQETILRVRTPKRIREALNEFALVCRGLAGTMYGNATLIPYEGRRANHPSGSTMADSARSGSAGSLLGKEGPGRELLARLNFLYQASRYRESMYPETHFEKEDQVTPAKRSPDDFGIIARHSMLNM